MQKVLMALGCAAVMMTGSTIASAQGSRASEPRGYGNYDQDRAYHQDRSSRSNYRNNRRSGRDRMRAEGSARERGELRRDLRQLGFSNIQIIDSAYLVQARTRDGRTVYMVIDPPIRAHTNRGAKQREQSGASDQRNRSPSNTRRHGGMESNSGSGPN